MQAPQPFRQIPKAHVLAKTDTPKTLVDVAKAYPDHPLMQFFQMAFILFQAEDGIRSS